MLYYVHVLKTYYAGGTARTIERRPHTAGSDAEAILTAKEKLRHSAPPTASGFSLRRHDGSEIYRWLKTETGMPRGPKGEKRPPT